MKAAMKTLVLLPVLALSGCAFTSYCEGEQKYQTAVSYPPLQAVEGVKIPDSQAALRIPQPPANQVAFGEVYKDEDGDDAVRCLDKPPAMPEIKPEATNPVETPKPAISSAPAPG